MSEKKGIPKSAIAVVGMAGRFPGARNVREFWRNLRDGVESLTPFTDEELLASGIDPQMLADPAYVKAGTLLENADEFDAGFFGFNPREAALMDPQHRIFLECAWEALEDAGYDTERLAVPVGIFAGASMNTYVFANLMANPEAMVTAGGYQTMIGNDKDFLATRVSYKLNLRGPGLTVQTACSTSLVAVHLACESLITHQCDMALAGGVSLNFPQRSGYLYQEGMIFSPDGHVRPFDAKGGGIRAGQGAGIVVLKRLADAIADGDCIRAVIRGTAINNDGAQKVGYTAPSVDGQAEAIATAQSIAEVEPKTIGYIEAHGTATPLGDPIEIAALSKAFGKTLEQQYCAIGSVKSNLGHLDAAAGVAGLIKTVLALQHRELPASLNFESPNPQIDFATSPFFVNTKLRAWESKHGARRAGVSSFGIGGTNAHAVLEEAPLVEASAPSDDEQLLVLSAKSARALDAASERLADHLEARPDLNLADVAYTLQEGRRVFEHRRVIVARDAASVRSALTTDRRRVLSGRHEGTGRPVAFMFSGQGSQHVGMGWRLYGREPVFRNALDECAEKLRAHLGLDLREALYPELAARSKAAEPSADRINATELAQPALFAIEYSLAKLWMHRGVVPQAMIGHSIGEYTAACLAGVFSLDSALEIVATRGSLMQKMAAGSMLAVPLDEADLAPYLDSQLALAAINAPAMSVVAGPTAAIEALEKRLESASIAGRRLRTSHAFHSQMMEPALEPFVAVLSREKLSAPRIPFVSNLTGTWITDAQATDPNYWARHLRSTVRFADGIRTLARDSGRFFIEVGPGVALRTLSRQTIQVAGDDVVLASLPPPGEPQGDDVFFSSSLARAWLAGVQIRWTSLHEGRSPRRVALPTYPFEKQRHWVEPVANARTSAPAAVARMSNVRDWFWLPSWQRSLPIGAFARTAGEGAAAKRWLVFVDDSAGCQAVMAELARNGVELVTVREGDVFAGSSAGGYRIAPDRREDYERLVGDAQFDCILHCWNAQPAATPLDIAEARRSSFYSLLYLAQALGDAGSATPIPVLILCTGLYPVLGGESVDPARSLALGPAFVMSQDVPFLRSRVIDVSPADWNASGASSLARALQAEASADFTVNRVAYRAGYRWLAGTSAVPFDETRAGQRVIRERGAYLVTGGLSGVGFEISKHLAKSARARLLLTGRTPLPPRSEWSAALASADVAPEVKARISGVLEMEACGAEVLVASADAADESAMRTALDLAKARFGALNGVIHAAGLPGIGTLARKTPELAEAVLRPKLEGTLVIDRLLAGAELDFLVLFSSINSDFGWQGTTDYTSANAFLDAFAQSGLARSTRNVVAIGWAQWGSTGMAARTAAAGGAAAQKAFVNAAIGLEQGMDCLERVLASGVKQVFVSPRPMPEVSAEVARLTQQIQEQFQKAESDEDFLAPAQEQTRPDLETPYAAPTDPDETALCGIWETLLGVKPVGIHDNFFELGGHSLLATRVMARLHETFGVRLPMRVIFDAPTVAEFARQLRTVRSSREPGRTEVAHSAEPREEIEL